MGPLVFVPRPCECECVCGFFRFVKLIMKKEAHVKQRRIEDEENADAQQV